MSSRLNPYIQFKDNARQAMEFYQTVFGGELAINTFAEFGAGDGPDANLVMHSQLETPTGYTLMGSDTPSHMTYAEGARITISLSGTEGDELRG
jgi:PhnB protein